MKNISVVSPAVWLVRHGETPWSILGHHTGRTNLGLTSRGKQQAVALGSRLGGHLFGLVLTSPLLRASETCRLAGLCNKIGRIFLNKPGGSTERRRKQRK